MSPTLDTVYRHSEDVISRFVEGELLIIPLVAGIGDMENDIFSMDETGKEIWTRLNGEKSAAVIIQELEEVFHAAPDVIRADVLGLLDELARRRLIIAVEKPV